MRYHLLIILSLLLSTVLYGQNKIIISKGLRRNKIKIGKTIGVTLKGESFKYESWKFLCSVYSDSSFSQYIWKLDSINKNYIIVSQRITNDTAYIFDTITYQDRKKIRLYRKDWVFVDEIMSPDSIVLNDKLVYKYPIYLKRRKIPIDSIQSFSFSRSNDCIGYDIFVPLFALIGIIGSPIIAIDHGKFDVGVFVVGETLGLLVAYSMFLDYKNDLVKTYSKDDWQIRIK